MEIQNPNFQEFKGYIFKIMGGSDKQGFPMKQGDLTPGRVRLLMHRGTPAFVDMEGVMENAGVNLFEAALSVPTFLF
ncbi:hypothetical protein SUGI_0568220 [Cryptomeria japonica]|nr:hypothetical protein SUGI_0568220 [Cryptomeria japonica]